MHKNICMIYTFYCQKDQSSFLTHIPLRTKKSIAEKDDLHVLYYGYLDEDVLKQSGIKIQRICFFKSKIVFTCLRALLLFFSVMFYGKNQNIQVFINANQFTYMFVVSLAARLVGSKVIVRVAGGINKSTRNKIPKKIKRWIKYFFGSLSIHSSHLTITVSNCIKKQLKINSKIQVLYPGVDIQQFRMKDRARIEKKPENICFIGRITKNKGLERGIRIFLKLKNDCPALKFYIYGDGPNLSIFRQKYSHSDIHFEGYVSHDQIPHIFAQNDILLFPSDFESFGLVVAEAMASGTPVVASSVGGLTELIKDNVTGFSLDLADEMGFIGAVKKLIDDKDSRLRMVYAARQHVENVYSMDQVKKKFSKIFEKIGL